MKVISVKQPFAQLLCLGAKRIETRTFETSYRGPLLIHASKSVDWAIMLCRQDPFNKFVPSFQDLTYGYIIGQVTIIDVKSVEDLETHENGNLVGFSENEIEFGDYTYGRKGWIVADPILFKNPIPARGMLGIWNFDLPKDHV